MVRNKQVKRLVVLMGVVLLLFPVFSGSATVIAVTQEPLIPIDATKQDEFQEQLSQENIPFSFDKYQEQINKTEAKASREAAMEEAKEAVAETTEEPVAPLAEEPVAPSAAEVVNADNPRQTRATGFSLDSYNFPDPEFLDYLRKGATSSDVFFTSSGDPVRLASSYFITAEENNKIYSILMFNAGKVGNLTGLHLFTSLTRLTLDKVKITTSAQIPKQLAYLNMSTMPLLTAINLQEFPKLQGFYARDNRIKELDTRSNPNLKVFDVSGPTMNRLLLGNHPNLEEFGLTDNNQQLTKVNWDTDGVLDMTKYPKLKKFSFGLSNFHTVNLSSNLKVLEEVYMHDLPNVHTINFNNGVSSIKKLHMSRMPKYQTLSLTSTSRSTLVELILKEVGLTDLDLTKATLLEFVQIINIKDLANLQFNSYLWSMKLLYLDKLPKIGSEVVKNVYTATHIEELVVEKTKVDKLVVPRSSKLKRLDVGYNSLTELVIPAEANNSLENLHTMDNKLAVLDTSGLRNLEEVDVSNNHLKKLDLSASTSKEIRFWGENQTSTATAKYQHASQKWQVDFNEVVGAGNTGRVENITNPWTYNAPNATHALDTKPNLPYNYNVGPRTGSQRLEVLLSLTYTKDPVAAEAVMTLTPDKKVVNSGEVVTWTVKITNLTDRLMSNITLTQLLSPTSGSESFRYVAGSTIIRSHGTTPQKDNVWAGSYLVYPDGVTVSVAKTGPLVLTFQTTATGDADRVFETTVKGTSTHGLVSDSDTFRIRNEDEPIQSDRVEIALTPDKKVVTSGDVVTWTVKLSNLDSSLPLMSNITLTQLLTPTSGSELFKYVPGSTINVSHGGTAGSYQDDNVWRGGFILYKKGDIPVSVAKTGPLVLTFQTIATGAADRVFRTTVKATSSHGLVSDSDTFRIRNKDETVEPDLGDIALKNVPVRFHFKDIKPQQPVIQNAAIDTTKYGNFAQSYGLYVKVRESRVSSGWQLTAKLGELASDDSKSSLIGASVQFMNPPIHEVFNPEKPNEYEESSVSNPEAPTLNNPSLSIVTSAAAVSIMDAKSSKGKGTWKLVLPLDDIKLNVQPNTGVAEHSYSGTMTWTLTDAPI